MKQKIKITLYSLIITLSLLLPICAISRENILKNSNNNIYTSNSKSKIKYNIPKKQDLTILFILEQNNEEIYNNINNTNNLENNIKNSYPNNKIKGTEEKYIIFKISAHDNYITLANFPKNFKTIAQTNEGFPLEEETLDKIYKKYGSYQLKNTIENNMKIEIDKIIKIDYNSISSVINQLGGIKIAMNDKKNKKNYYKIITTEEQQKILKKDPIKIFLLLKNNFNNKTNLSNFFATISNLSSTDITIYDFESRKKGFEKMIKENDSKINIVNIEIINKNNRNKLTDKCITECEKMFK